ncbi:hypothetical protein PR048_033750 [Dryococelus australis]|uniref:Uncharacterized protein n=1 Tax=Dryococelus australis TaxID=614101 RepID=A0ABQ9G3A8_9NEOP|nr:hypothetical protein PR048_033750 [Dryococelus australis]
MAHPIRCIALMPDGLLVHLTAGLWKEGGLKNAPIQDSNAPASHRLKRDLYPPRRWDGPAPAHGVCGRFNRLLAACAAQIALLPFNIQLPIPTDNPLGSYHGWVRQGSLPQMEFQEFKGCLEHNFLTVVSLNLENAIGSIHHSYLGHILQEMGVPASPFRTIADLYTGGSTRIRTPEGDTESVPISAGVRKVCPLSPILFNLGMEQLIRCVARQAEDHG